MERGGEGHSGFEQEFEDCTEIIMECLSREEKAWKWRDRGELGQNKCRGMERKGHKRGRGCVSRLLVSALVSLTLQLIITSHLLVKLHF